MSPPTLAAIGDSLTQGFQSGAIHKTEWSYATIVARALDLDVPMGFRVPRIPGPGLPLNIEDMLRVVGTQLGSDISTAEWILKFPRLAHDYIDGVEDYYERGGGTLPPKFRGIYHNLAVWGFTVHESMTLHAERCAEAIDEGEGWIEDDFLGTPSAPMYRTARRVLNPGADAVRARDTQVGALARLARTEPPDVLLLWLGANDCLATVLTLDVQDMEDAPGPIPADPMGRLAWNLTSGAQFEADYRALVAGVDAALGNHPTRIFVGTVPHVTIPPITTGVGHFDGTYFDHYARFFVSQQNFNPFLHKSLTRADARRIDGRIDRYNATIRAVVQARNDAEAARPAATRRSWHVVDTCATLDALAVKRQGLEATPEQALLRYYARQGITNHPLLQLSPIPSVLLLRTDEDGTRSGGGLISLDGVHPSTIGHGLLAEVFLAEMQRVGVPGADPRRVAWQDVIAHDSLLQNPPRVWDDVCEAGSEHATLWDLIFRVIS